jgi:Protein kinase domain
MIGEAVGAYTVLTEIGRGGMGVVFLAEHRHLGRMVAIKFLLREFTENPGLLQRFFTEARASSLIEHDGIVRILDCDTHPSGHAYIVMEYLEGTTLRAHLARRGPLPFPEAAAVMVPICEAMAAAHAKQIVHRDLKPDNIFLLDKPAGAIKIVDFGVAKLGGAAGAPTRTLSGTLLGTPLYMSPEQARGTGPMDERTDVYSLGCVLFEMICGRPPFVHTSVGELIAAHLREPPPPVASFDRSAPAPLCALISRMLAKSADERPSVAELTPALKAFSTGRGTGRATAAEAASSWPVNVARFPGMAALPADSTLRYANGEATAPTGGRLRWAILTLALGAVVAGGALWRPWRALRHPIELAPLPAPVASDSFEQPPPPALDPATRSSAAPIPPPTVETPEPSRPVHAGRTVRERAIHLTITTDPPGAAVCLPERPIRLGTTNATLKLRSTTRKQTLLLYRLGYRVQQIEVRGDQDSSRRVSLQRLAEDDLKELPPCR